MVVRDLKDGRSVVSLQEDHAELAAQFAAHWGNERFAKLRPYQTMLFATTYHDSGYREWEGNPPMNMEKGRPYLFSCGVAEFLSCLRKKGKGLHDLVGVPGEKTLFCHDKFSAR